MTPKRRIQQIKEPPFALHDGRAESHRRINLLENAILCAVVNILTLGEDAPKPDRDSTLAAPQCVCVLTPHKIQTSELPAALATSRACFAVRGQTPSGLESLRRMWLCLGYRDKGASGRKIQGKRVIKPARGPSADKFNTVQHIFAR